MSDSRKDYEVTVLVKMVVKADDHKTATKLGKEVCVPAEYATTDGYAIAIGKPSKIIRVKRVRT